MEKILNQQVTDFKNKLQQHPAINNVQIFYKYQQQPNT